MNWSFIVVSMVIGVLSVILITEIINMVFRPPFAIRKRLRARTLRKLDLAMGKLNNKEVITARLLTNFGLNPRMLSDEEAEITANAIRDVIKEDINKKYA